MNVSPETVKLIFGLKISQLRKKRDLSLAQLAKTSGLSVSYINEIEKGKKYPKTHKIMGLASALEVPYDELVSLKLGHQLNPITDLISSNFLNEVPFDFFGINPMSLIEMLANAPAKVSAFIKTVVDIGRNYNLSVEQFYFAVLRSYQELHLNFFPELEKFAADFLDEQEDGVNVDENYLTTLINLKFGVSITYFDEKDFPNLSRIRSVFREKKKNLLLNRNTSTEQRAFTIAREIGFLQMGLKERPLTSSWVEVKSFEEVFNNFKASYFAGAILINKSKLLEKITYLFGQPTWQPEAFQALLSEFSATPEMLLHRISNIISPELGISNFYFFRFEATQGEKDYRLTKEMHLSNNNEPHATQSEHYCRRWLAFKMIDEVAFQVKKGIYTKPIIDIQRSVYENNQRKYLLITLARPLNILKNTNESVTVGFEIDDNLNKKIRFLNDTKIPEKIVNHTCERCGIFDCQERVAAPKILQKERYLNQMKASIDSLI